MVVESYPCGKVLERFQRDGKFYHRVQTVYKWRIIGKTTLSGFRSEHEANLFLKQL